MSRHRVTLLVSRTDHERHDMSTIRATREHLAAYEEAAQLRAAIAALEADLKSVTEPIREAMAAQRLGAVELHGTALFRLDPVTRESIDRKRLAADHPELAARYTVTTTSSRFTVARGVALAPVAAAA